MKEKEVGYIIVYDWMAEVTEHERLFGLIFSLCKTYKVTEIDIAMSYIAERLHKTVRTINNWIADMIEEGCISVDFKRGRGARNTFKLNTKLFSHFLSEKIRKDWLENTKLNTKHISDFNGLPLIIPSNNINDVLTNEYNIENNNSSFEASTKAEEENEIKKDEKIVLFREDEEVNEINPEVKKQFGQFWQMFKPEPEMKSRYKRALIEWSQMSELWRHACLELLRGGRHPQNEKNPYYYLQHFSPENYFIDGRSQYDMWKRGMQLCRVRYMDKQPIVTPYIAELFELQVLDDHFEKGFDN